MVELKGLHRVKSGGKEYVYAWRGGPCIKARPVGGPAFMAEYNEAVASRRGADSSKFRAIVTRYRASDAFTGLADTTRRVWGRWLDRIGMHFGDLSIRQFDRPERIRPIIRKWRSTWSAQPRTADYGMQVLSRVLSYAVEDGKIAANPCEGIKQLYSTNRAEIIWTEADIAQLRAKASAEVMHAVDLAAATGLRPADLFRLAWSNIGEDAIVITTSKSRHRKEAVIPLYDDLRALLRRIPKRSTVVLTTGRDHRPWRGFSSSFAGAMEDAGMDDRDLHFYDLRGTAATRFYLAGLSERVIAEIMGWEEETVTRIIRRYVDRQAAVKATILQMRAAKRRTGGVKTAVKTRPEPEA
jgi:integrase